MINSWTVRTIVGATLGILAALLVGKAVTAYIDNVANEIHRPVVAQYGSYPTLKASQAAHVATQRAAMEGGLRGRVAGIILDNNGIGYPEPRPAAARVWVVMALAGAVIGACASWRNKSSASFLAMIVLLLGINAIWDGPVALFHISVALVACAMITFVIFALLNTERHPNDGRKRGGRPA